MAWEFMSPPVTSFSSKGIGKMVTMFVPFIGTTETWPVSGLVRHILVFTIYGTLQHITPCFTASHPFCFPTTLGFYLVLCPDPSTGSHLRVLLLGNTTYDTPNSWPSFSPAQSFTKCTCLSHASTCSTVVPSKQMITANHLVSLHLRTLYWASILTMMWH